MFVVVTVNILYCCNVKFKSKRKFAYLWSEAGSQMDLETKFGLMFGFPALAAFNV